VNGGQTGLIIASEPLMAAQRIGIQLHVVAQYAQPFDPTLERSFVTNGTGWRVNVDMFFHSMIIG
jgi:hypothetical protein